MKKKMDPDNSHGDPFKVVSDWKLWAALGGAIALVAVIIYCIAVVI